MIKLCRVDHRLLHGQVAFSWSHALGADAILIVSDEVASNEVRSWLSRASTTPSRQSKAA